MSNCRVGEGAEDEDDILTEPALPVYKKTDSFVNPGYGSMDNPKTAFAEKGQNGVVKTENGGLKVENGWVQDEGKNTYVNPAMDQAAYGATIVPMESVGQSKFIGNYYHKNLKNWDTRKFAVIALKCEQCGFTLSNPSKNADGIVKKCRS